jgi:RecA/RadA recombinase
MSKLLSKLQKNSKVKANVLSESEFLINKESVVTEFPILNVALSGSLRGGLSSGLGTIAGPSKHFKSLMGLLCMKAYLDKYEDAVMVFYDSEFGTPMSYFKSMGIDPDRVLHKPINDVEELKHDVTNLLRNDIEKEDKVVIFIDSIGNLASRKEADDAESGKQVADMTRAKQLKSLFRIVTPHLTTKDIPMVVINHTYDTLDLFSKQVVSGGKGSYYSSDWIWIIGRQQEKKAGAKEIEGYNFIINIEKSRHVKEKSKLPLTVTYDKGLYKYSGLLDMALDGNFIFKANNVWYQAMDSNTGEILDKKYKKADLGPVFEDLLTSDKFNTYVESKYKLEAQKMITEELDEDGHSDD